MSRPRAGDLQVRAVLTFTEIGARLGISRQSAQQACGRGLRKLLSETPNTIDLMQVYAEDLVDRRDSQNIPKPRKLARP
jgi:hypothetical protein